VSCSSYLSYMPLRPVVSKNEGLLNPLTCCNRRKQEIDKSGNQQEVDPADAHIATHILPLRCQSVLAVWPQYGCQLVEVGSSIMARRRVSRRRALPVGYGDTAKRVRVTCPIPCRGQGDLQVRSIYPSKSIVLSNYRH